MIRALFRVAVLALLVMSLLSCQQITELFTANPTAPGSLTASQGTYPDQIVLTWRAAGNADTHRVYAAPSQNEQFTRLSGEVVDTTVAITGVDPGVHYFYKVAGVNSANEQGPFSTVAEGWATLPAPEGLTASQGTYGDRINLSWTAVTGAAKYGIYEATSEAGNYTKLVTEPTTTSVDVTGVTIDTHYWFTVVAETADGIEGEQSTAVEGWSAYSTIQWVSDGTGYYQLFTNDPTKYNTFYSNVFSGWNVSSGSSFTAKVKKLSGDADQDFGIIFGNTSTSYFWYVGINTHGDYKVWLYDGTWTVMRNWTAHSALNTGTSLNTLKATYNGYNSSTARYEIDLYFNGSYITTAQSTGSLLGHAGLGVQVGSSTQESFPGTPVDVRFQITSPTSLPDVAPAQSDSAAVGSLRVLPRGPGEPTAAPTPAARLVDKLQ